MNSEDKHSNYSGIIMYLGRTEKRDKKKSLVGGHRKEEKEERKEVRGEKEETPTTAVAEISEKSFRTSSKHQAVFEFLPEFNVSTAQKTQTDTQKSSGSCFHHNNGATLSLLGTFYLSKRQGSSKTAEFISRKL